MDNPANHTDPRGDSSRSAIPSTNSHHGPATVNHETAEPNTQPPQRRFLTHRGLRLSYLDSHPTDNPHTGLGGHPTAGTAGEQRPVVLLLHGFPDHALMWTQHFAALAAAGLRVIAPDTVGCGHSAIAPRVSDYRLDNIVSDLVFLLDQIKADTVDVVGHDWGAVIAWFLAGHHPGRVRRMVAMSVGHPTSYARAALPQKLRSWYIGYFLLAGLAERGLRAGPGPLNLSGWGHSHPDLDGVRARLREPGRLTAALRIYRANIATVLFRRHPRVSAACLGIWSTDDEYLTRAQMLGSQRFLDGLWRYEQLSSGHWIPLEQPRRAAELILSHIT